MLKKEIKGEKTEERKKEKKGERTDMGETVEKMLCGNVQKPTQKIWVGQLGSAFAKISRKTINHSHITVRRDQIIWTKHSKPGNTCQ